LAALSHDWQVAVWDRVAGRLLHVHEITGGANSTADNAGLAFSHDGRFLAAAAAEQAKLWDVASGKEERAWKLDYGLVNQMMFDPTDKKLLLFRVESPSGRWGDPAKNPRSCVVRDLLAPRGVEEPLYTISDFPWSVETALAAPDGHWFAITGTRGPGEKGRSVRVFKGVTGEEMWNMNPTPHDMASSLQVDPGSEVLGVWNGKTGQLQLVGLAGKEALATLEPGVTSLGPKRLLATRSAESPDVGAIRHTLVSIEGGKETPLLVLGLHGRPMYSAIQFNSAGTHLAWGNEDGTVSVCDIPEVQRRLAAVGLGW
jgi:WD40 repeat protein